jgi:hypothetical protein
MRKVPPGRNVVGRVASAAEDEEREAGEMV